MQIEENIHSKELLDVLALLGIEEKQGKVYLALLELGMCSIQKISEVSGVKRTSIYNFLDSMQEQGLIFSIQKGTRSYIVPENPEILLQKAKKQLSLVQNTLPSLLSLYNMPGAYPKVKFYTGKEGLKRVYNEFIKKSKEPIYGFSDYEKMFSALDEDWLWEIPLERRKNKCKFYSIAKEGPYGRMVQKKDEEQYRQTKLVKEVQFDTEINIFSDKVLFFSFRRPFMVAVIEDRAIAQTFYSVWKLVWNSLK